MRLSEREFRAMNSGVRRFFHRHVELPIFLRMGLAGCRDKDVVELGCGNGFGAALIAALRPRSYVGLDVMPEQIALAQKRELPNTRFFVGDATRLTMLANASADVVVVFGILHHIEAWQKAVAECGRLLRSGGPLLVEEPDAALLGGWDRIFAWDHPHGGFSLRALERELDASGLVVEARVKIPGTFGVYRARKPPRV